MHTLATRGIIRADGKLLRPALIGVRADGNTVDRVAAKLQGRRDNPVFGIVSIVTYAVNHAVAKKHPSAIVMVGILYGHSGNSIL